MNSRYWAKLILISIVILCSGTGLAQAQIFGVLVDPDLKWQTLQTEHFNVHFHQGLEDLAYEVAQISEEYYSVIEGEFGEAPQKFDVVILDAFDFSNGSANFLTNFVTLIPSQYRLSDWANVRLDSWWDMLIFHELVHAIELDMTTGINQVLRSIFGKTIFPNISKPIPFIEGLAVYEKYKYKGESRLNDSRTRMVLRQMVIDNEIPDFEDIKGLYNSTDWPQPGFLVYNFGSWLMRYIEETYGDDAMRRFDEANAARPENLLLMGNLNSVLLEVFEVSADELYEGFRSWLRDEFQAELLAIQENPITRPVQITQTGYSTGQPAWSPNGEWIAYVHSGPGRQGLRLISPMGEDDHEITNGAGLAYPDWSPLPSDESADYQPKLLYSKLEAKGPYYVLRDLYEYDVTRDREERLTHQARAYFARYASDNSQIIYYAHNHGRDGSTALSRLNRESGESELILEFTQGDGIIHSFSISPDGSQFALAIWRHGGFQDLYTMPIEGGELTPITQNQDQLSDPIWTPDGAYILYSADPNKRYNLYAYEVASGEFFQVTNMISGAFYPTFSPNSEEIAFGGYEGSGYDIFKIPFNPSTWMPVEPAQETRPEWEGYPVHTQQYQPYNGISHLVPKGWFPVPLEDGLGVLAFGADPLLSHLYQVIAGWDFARNQPYYNIAYNLTLGLPINIFLKGSGASHTESANITVPLSIALSSSQQTMTAGYTRTTEFEIVEEGADEPTVLETPRVTNLVSANYTFSSSHREDFFGMFSTLSTTVELWNQNSSTEWKKRVVVNLSEQFRLPELQTHTLQTRFAAGWTDAEDDDELFKLGATMEEFLLLKDQYTLRGFPADAFTGRQFMLTSLQQNFRLIEIERGITQWPLYIDDLGLSLFMDAGLAADKLNLKKLAFGYGAEISLSITAAYGFGFEILGGVAQGIGEESPQLYISFNVEL